MEITEIIKKAIKYPTISAKGFFLFAILIILANLTFFTNSTGNQSIIGIIFSIIVLISYCLMLGYDIFIIKEGIDKSNKFPTLDFVKYLVNGIKSIILAVIYFIIPLIILIGVAFLMNLPQKINEIMTFLQTTIQSTPTTGSTNPISFKIFSTMPNYDTILTDIGIFVTIALILIFIFGIFYVIGKCRLAKYDSLKSGLNFPAVIGDIKKIGTGDCPIIK